MTPQELKNSILQLAIQGKLVEQRPEEGTAEELYKQIQVEKQALIKARKIKKEKPLPEITEDEIPFEIPDSWKWVRLRDICIKIVDGDHNPPSGIPEETRYWMLSAQNINNNKLTNLDQVRYLSKDVFIREDERTRVQPGDIFFTIVATLGRSCVYEGGYNICFQRSVSVITTLTYNYYLKYVLDSGYIQQFMTANATGTAQKGFYLNQVEKLLIALPPLSEQKRIVVKIEELLPLIDCYENAWTRLEDFNKRFPGDMQKSILQMAIQGKLVEQRVEEGTGDELYQQIQAEKQELINAGKVKKDRRIDEIVNPSEEETPFEIPETWKWVYLGSILNKLTDGTHKTPNYSTNGVKFVSVKDMSNGVLSLRNTKYITASEHEELFARCDPVRGDMLLSKVGTTGVPAIVDTDEPFSLFVSVALLKYSHNCIDEAFLYYLLKSPLVQMQATENTRGVGNKNWVLDEIAKTLVVLPPLAEQKRIVAKINDLLSVCKRLK